MNVLAGIVLCCLLQENAEIPPVMRSYLEKKAPRPVLAYPQAPPWVLKKAKKAKPPALPGEKKKKTRIYTGRWP